MVTKIQTPRTVICAERCLCLVTTDSIFAKEL